VPGVLRGAGALCAEPGRDQEVDALGLRGAPGDEARPHEQLREPDRDPPTRRARAGVRGDPGRELEERRGRVVEQGGRAAARGLELRHARHERREEVDADERQPVARAARDGRHLAAPELLDDRREPDELRGLAGARVADHFGARLSARIWLSPVAV
jgi:hypothetical protein